MTIDDKRLGVVKVGKLLDVNETLRIPDYQRPYSWTTRHVLRLLNDLILACHEHPEQDYALGSIILHRAIGANHDDVVDGQQRLITLSLIDGVLEDPASKAPEADSESPIGVALHAIRQRIPGTGPEADRLKNYIRDHGSLVQVVTDDRDEAFRIFDSQNHRGRSLQPHDLLKAHHLREMRSESEMARTAVIEAWEKVPEEQFSVLFGDVLYPVMSWLRGERALGFTVEDLDLFKGISSWDHTPRAQYHRAAQSALAVLQSWQDMPQGDDRARNLQRSRFPLDAPIVAGQEFFEMVEFLRNEVERLKEGLFGEDSDLTRFASERRYRYVNLLLVCSALYATNKFGEDALETLRKHLIIWAYTIRLDNQRVTWRGIDNYVLIGGTVADERKNNKNNIELFRRIRHADSVETVLTGSDLAPLLPPDDPEKKDLFNMLKKIQRVSL